MTRRDRNPLVDRAIALGVTDERVLDAMRHIPRVAFVPPAARLIANRDAPVPIGHGQTTSQPSLIAHVVAELELTPRDRVLEVGTGLGYQTAMLAALAAEVYSIDRFEDLVEAARGNLEAHGVRNVTLRTGDGTEGWPEHAPFDAIVVTAAPEEVPAPLVEQLAPGGRLVVPVGGQATGQSLRVLEKDAAGEISTRDVLPVRFVPCTRD